MTQEILEYYTVRCRNLEKAAKWVLAYAKLYNKHYDDSKRFWQIKYRGDKAVDRLEKLL